MVRLFCRCPKQLAAFDDAINPCLEIRLGPASPTACRRARGAPDRRLRNPIVSGGCDPTRRGALSPPTFGLQQRLQVARRLMQVQNQPMKHGSHRPGGLDDARLRVKTCGRNGGVRRRRLAERLAAADDDSATTPPASGSLFGFVLSAQCSNTPRIAQRQLLAGRVNFQGERQPRAPQQATAERPALPGPQGEHGGEGAIGRRLREPSGNLARKLR